MICRKSIFAATTWFMKPFRGIMNGGGLPSALPGLLPVI
jgi:hypothetical protein